VSCLLFDFAVKLYVNNELSDQLVNVIGPYEGTWPILTGDQVYLEIDADGDWAATMRRCRWRGGQWGLC
jgi:hypothetical protein